jgi:hypothetical protein
MDPLHPIIPIQPNIPPIAPAPMVGGVNRDAPHSGDGQDKRRRRRAPAEAQASSAHGYEELDYGLEDPDGEDDTGLHINVTA